MLLKIDAAQLEWRVKIFLAQDQVGMAEIENYEKTGFDIHTSNQKNFKLPSRVIAKNFIYQMIFQDAFGERGFHGAAGGFAAKADFQHVFTGTKKEKIDHWLGVVESFFKKYPEIKQHSVDLITEATTTGRIVVPSGRFYPFSPEPDYFGNPDWPRTKILNYPIQGFSADLVQLARLIIWEWWDTQKGLLINTVHDDVEADVDNNPEVVYNICIALEESFKAIPRTFKQKYGSEINVPMSGEVKYGINLNEKFMRKFKRETFFEDYKEYTDKYAIRN